MPRTTLPKGIKKVSKLTKYGCFGKNRGDKCHCGDGRNKTNRLAIRSASPPEMVARSTGEHASRRVDALSSRIVQNAAPILPQSTHLTNHALRSTTQQPSALVSAHAIPVPAVADGPARRAASRCTQRSSDRLPNDRRKYCQHSSTDDGRRHFIILSIVCRTKLTTRCSDRRALAKFSKSKVWKRVPKESRRTLIFVDMRYFLAKQGRIGRRKHPNQ